MNDPKSPPAGGKSPFAHRATRATPPANDTPPVAAVPEPSSPQAVPASAPATVAPTEKGGGRGLLLFAAGLIVVGGAVAALFSGGDGGARAIAPQSGKSAIPADPAEALRRAEADFGEGLALVRKHGGDRLSAEEFSRVLVLESDARAAKAAGKTSGAAGAFDAAAKVAGNLADRAAGEALARLRPTDMGDLAPDASRIVETAAREADAARASGDFLRAAKRRDAALAGVASVTKDAGARLGELAASAVTRGDRNSARVFYRKLAGIDPGNTVAAAWLMTAGLDSGEALRSAKLGLDLVYIRPGAFTEGSPDSEPGRETDEVTRVTTITKGFWMGRTEVTQAQWDAVMGAGSAAARLSREKKGFAGPDLPMVDVTWRDAAEYCRRLSLLEGRRFRLPTEAEWEYACRAGSTTAYSTGKNFLSPGESVVDDGTARAPVSPRDANAPGVPSNAWGLRDMHGNVWEWCSDWYAPRSAGAATDPSGPDDATAGRSDTAMKTARGGSWNDPAGVARSANRWQYSPVVAVDYIGFRVVMEFSPDALPR